MYYIKSATIHCQHDLYHHKLNLKGPCQRHFAAFSSKPRKYYFDRVLFPYHEIILKPGVKW